MAKRPIFLISNKAPFFEAKEIEFKYHSGFADIQKKKSINSLHEAFLNQYPNRKILEISSKSETLLGIKLSAFNLTIKTVNNNEYPIELIFQSSKVFENGGPYLDILNMTPRQAKKDSRIKEGGKLLHFNCFGTVFKSEPKTFFYNWLYLNALQSRMDSDLVHELINYDSFTDIEFNPKKSINCQAIASAIFVSLYQNSLLEKALSSKENFLEIVYNIQAQKNHLV